MSQYHRAYDQNLDDQDADDTSYLYGPTETGDDHENDDNIENDDTEEHETNNIDEDDDEAEAQIEADALYGDPFAGVALTAADSTESNKKIDYDPFAGIEMSLDEAEQVLRQPSPPLTSIIRTPPTYTDNPAEVIAVTTSLKGMVHAHFASLRLKHFLACKRIKWVDIDTNRDYISGQELRNSELIEEWERNGLLARGSDGRIELPQCIIDGVQIGDYTSVSELEEDGNFDYIINRSICPSCLSEQRIPLGAEDENEDEEDGEGDYYYDGSGTVNKKKKGLSGGWSACEDCGKELGPVIPEEIYYAPGALQHMFADTVIAAGELVSNLPPPGSVIPYSPQFRLVGDNSGINLPTGFDPFNGDQLRED